MFRFFIDLKARKNYWGHQKIRNTQWPAAKDWFKQLSSQSSQFTRALWQRHEYNPTLQGIIQLPKPQYNPLSPYSPLPHSLLIFYLLQK